MELRSIDKEQIPAEHRGKIDESNYRFAPVETNETLLDGFVLLRLAQLLNSDVYYIGLLRQRRHSGGAGKQAPRRKQSNAMAALTESKQHLVESEIADSKRTPDELECGKPGCSSSSQPQFDLTETIDSQSHQNRLDLSSPSNNTDVECEPLPPGQRARRNLLDELADVNPCRGLFERKPWLSDLSRMICIGLSLVAIMISVDKTISTILLCLISRPDIKARPGNIGIAYETSDITMSWLVLILLNISSMYILFSTVFNGHLLWNLLNQRLFLVSRCFQYKTMLSMFVFIYLEYIINISFVNNLFGWSFETNDNDVASEGPAGARWHKAASGGDLAIGGVATGLVGQGSGRSSAVNLQGNIVGSYSVLSNIKTFVTEKDETNPLLDVLLTIFQFARGIIRISPYITINYVTICLNEHIKTIRNQSLLTESLKRKQRLKMVVKSKRTNQLAPANRQNSTSPQRPSGPPTSGRNTNAESTRKKRVIFVTEASSGGLFPTSPSPAHSEASSFALRPSSRASLSASPNLSMIMYTSPTPSPSSMISQANSVSPSDKQPPGDADENPNRRHRAKRWAYLDRIRDFNELEADVTNLYIFTGRLNRLMSRQGLAFFFIVHNLVITTTLIVPEAISGGSFMVQLVRVLVVFIGIVPFVAGQALDGQLEQLSKQIDRIIIKQQFISRKRDNLVRIRELLYDIRVNCGGMLDFNIETGIKYLVVAFATAFFIEQEGKLSERDSGRALGSNVDHWRICCGREISAAR